MESIVDNYLIDFYVIIPRNYGQVELPKVVLMAIIQKLINGY